MTVNVTNEEIVILAGETQVRNLPGAQVICYASTDEIQVSMDNRGWLPFSRGIELNSPDGAFSNLYFKNPTGSTVTLEVAVVSEPRVFVDRRELAASIAVDGGIVTNTAPLTDQGGSIGQVAASIYNSVETGTSGDIVSAASNTNGIRIRSALLQAWGGASTAVAFIRATSQAFCITNSVNPHSETNREFHIPAGQPLYYFLPAAMQAYIRVSYDIL